VVVVGRGWADGKVELRDRFSGESVELDKETAVADIVKAVRGS
jgi:prolyl-tRNA synthetase